LRDCWIAVGAFIATVTASWSVMRAQGVSSSGMFSALVLENLHYNVFGHAWFFPLEMAPLWCVWAVAGLGAAFWLDRTMRRDPQIAQSYLSRAKFALGLGVLILAAFRPSMPQGYSPVTYTMLPGFLAPFCWMLLYVPSPEMESQTFARILLSAGAILQTMWAHPMASTQGCFIRIMLIIAGVVLLGDAFAGSAPSVAESSDAESSPAKSSIDLRRPLRVAGISFLILLPLRYWTLANLDGHTYQSRPSLALPGATRVHVPATQVHALQWLVRNVRENCDVVMGLPGFLSLNLWSGIASPVAAEQGGDWMDSLDNQQQAEAISTLAAHRDACIIYNPREIDSWPGKRDLNTLQLVRYIFGNFKTAGTTDIAFTKLEVGKNLSHVRYYFMVKKDRNLVLAPTLRPPADTSVEAAPQPANTLANTDTGRPVSSTNIESR
jgi:hypothetical protein